ncbi:Sortase family protein [Pedococcus dokdonensis]|uniref:Sortase family protein n=1 Tax=Pedococcus dokdonensis TaxID=443156 RepID=A0A1H0UGD9_9MICO|nr:Sortase family protein [Pedococcus dokdonensis]
MVLCGSSLAACGGPAEAQRGGPATASSAAASGPATTAASPSGEGAAGDPRTPPPAGVGRPAASQRLTFAPERIRLSSDGGASAPVQRVDTGASGELELPADPGVTGWWVSGALAGEVYGSVVLAGHIDSRERGIGFFAKLLNASPGDRIELTGRGLTQTYVVRTNKEVDKGALSTSTDIFDRSVRGRLVLLTCTGSFDPRTRHYDHNLVVTAYPVGVPRLAKS